MEQILHTPEGVRDIHTIEYKKKLALEEKLNHTLHLYGYQDIQTPGFEYFDVFGKEIGTIPSKELYKFFDREGNTLVLRPDFTPSIARAAATLFEAEKLPIRLCYFGNTFVNQNSYRGRMNENTKIGAELIGDDTIEADAEMIALVIECMKSSGLKEFQVNIGHVGYFQSMLDEAKLEKEDEERVRKLINNRNFFGVEELFDEISVGQLPRTAFSLLPELVGSVDVLEKARRLALNKNALAALDHLDGIYKRLVSYGVENYVTFDLSMSGTYGYYTGIVFRGYTFGTGDAVIKGGRYDHLLEKFGKKSPAIGFEVVVDELMNALSRQKILIPVDETATLIVYDEEKTENVIALVREFRQKGKAVEIVKKDPDIELMDYMDYGKSHQDGSMMYLENAPRIILINLLTDEMKIVDN